MSSFWPVLSPRVQREKATMASKEDSMKRWRECALDRSITAEESLKYYDSWAAHYDKDMDNIGYSKKLDHMQEKMNQLFPDRDERKKLKVLDIAAGTGLGGKRLFELGFTYIDGVDGSSGMLEKLKELGIYNKAFVAILGDPEKRVHPDIDEGFYDIATIMGAFAQSHLPIKSLYQVARTIKTGGLFINQMTKNWLTEVESLHGLEPLMKEMEREGIWKHIETFEVPGNPAPGIFHIYKKL